MLSFINKSMFLLNFYLLLIFRIKEEMKISFLIFISFTVVCAQKPPSSITSVKQSVQDLNNFCMGKTLDFCSKEHMEIAMSFLLKQQDQLMKNLEKELSKKILFYFRVH